VATVPTGAAPLGVFVDRGGDLCYVANFLSGDVTVIDTTTLQLAPQSPLPATSDVPLPAALGVTSAVLQDMWNQHFLALPGGPAGGSGDPLCDLQALFGPTGLGSGGVQDLLTNMLDQFLATLPLGGPTSPLPFVGLQAVESRGENLVYAANPITGTMTVISTPTLGGAPTVQSIGFGIANFGPNAISLWR
jgi:DNA-binding beta-propeller fold protein YncE